MIVLYENTEVWTTPFTSCSVQQLNDVILTTDEVNRYYATSQFAVKPFDRKYAFTKIRPVDDLPFIIPAGAALIINDKVSTNYSSGDYLVELDGSKHAIASVEHLFEDIDLQKFSITLSSCFIGHSYPVPIFAL